MGSSYIQRVWDTVAGKPVSWQTDAEDPDGDYYPGPGTYAVNTSDYYLVSIPSAGSVASVYHSFDGGTTQTEVFPPVELTVKTVTFNASEYDYGSTITAFVNISANLVAAGSIYVRVYDVGPVGGVATPAVEVTAALPSDYALGVTADGEYYLETIAFERGATSSAGQLAESDRNYEFRAYCNAGVGSTVLVEESGFKVKGYDS